ncbi:peptidoglycan recognition protein family protein [Staphylococcus delphini]|uniref:peptidoglycan recognition protein family protein n=1 Tax=Staphylococcus delphini TaxID=53344 RepID=UPI003364C829
MAKKYIGDWNGVPTYTEFLKIGTRRTGQRLDSGHPKFLVFHDTGNRNSTAQQNVNYYNNTYNQPWATTASAHVFVDDKECINCVPLEEKAWHVLYDAPTDNLWYGDDANDIAVGVEACYFSDKERSRKSFDNACEIAAFICKEYGINPRNQMPGHYQIQADKIDPKSVLEACGYSKDMSVVCKYVLKYLDGVAKESKPKESKPAPKPTPKAATKAAPKSLVKKQPKAAKRIKPWSEKAHYSGKIKYNASLREHSGDTFNNYSFGHEKGILEKVETVYIFEEIQDAQVNIWCRTYSPSNNGWVHKHTIAISK